MSARRYCFTINNPTQSDEDSLTLDNLKAKFLIYQHEEGSNHTPHIQGYVEFGRVVRHSAFKSLLPRSHFECAKGSGSQNITYCSKSPRLQPTIQLGTPTTQGQRNDLREYIKSVRRGSTDCELLEEYPQTAARYPRLRQQIRIADRTVSPVPLLELRHWQSILLELYKSEPHPRKIHWYWDRAGNTGKSAMARHLVATQNAFYITGGKHSDILCAYSLERTIVFDLPRAYQDKVPYTVMEAFKNGMIFSSKYESKSLIFDVPYVIVFANFAPEKHNLSLDRWDVHEIIEDVLQHLLDIRTI